MSGMWYPICNNEGCHTSLVLALQRMVAGGNCAYALMLTCFYVVSRDLGKGRISGGLFGGRTARS